VHRNAASCCHHVRLNDAKMPSSCGNTCCRTYVCGRGLQSSAATMLIVQMTSWDLICSNLPGSLQMTT
jgi:hypothetical protein